MYQTYTFLASVENIVKSIDFMENFYTVLLQLFRNVDELY